MHLSDGPSASISKEANLAMSRSGRISGRTARTKLISAGSIISPVYKQGTSNSAASAGPSR